MSRIVPVLRLALAACAASALVAAPVASAEPADRQQAFADAADEFGVPEDVLLAVSYLESRWQDHAGQPSTSAGYGPMHLTDATAAGVTEASSHHDHGTEDPRGDDARPLHDLAAPHIEAVGTAGLHTVAAAARLTGAHPEDLRTDPVQNIRGGAALLADYQRRIAPGATTPGAWYGAVARYGGATDTASAAAFADEVFGTLVSGVARTTDGGRVQLAANPAVEPRRDQIGELGLRETERADTECPPKISCESVPAPYEELPEGGYGNHDLADRPRDIDIDYIVIHDTETTYDQALQLVQDPAYVSWHYTLRSSDGHVAQHLATKDVGWHAGNWDVNARSIGLEHEGFGAQGTWYTEAMYRSSAKLVRYLADRYRIPLDREHILGHDNVPGTTPDKVAGMHWDPGPYWNWSHYFDLLGAPLHDSGTGRGLVTIQPGYETNRPAFTGCDADHPDAACPPRSSSAVVLRTEPRADAPLLSDIGLHPDGSPSTMDVSDIGSRTSAGQAYAVAGRQGDWTAVYYLGQIGWLPTKDTRPAHGLVVTPKAGRESVPVYGRAYPEASAYPEGVSPQEIVPLQYRFPAGQRYAAGPVVPSLYYAATTFDASEHVVVRGKTRYVQVQFGHRVAFVKADDVALRMVI